MRPLRDLARLILPLALAAAVASAAYRWSAPGPVAGAPGDCRIEGCTGHTTEMRPSAPRR